MSTVLVWNGSDLLAAAADAPIHISIGGAGATVELLAYAQPLDVLGLSAGPVSRAQCRPCALLDPSVAFIAPASSAGAWAKANGVDAGLLDALIPDRDRCSTCTSFTAGRLPVPGLDTSSTSFALPTDGERALVIASKNGAAYWVDAAGNVAPACTPSGGVETAAASGPHRIWTTDAGGCLARWDLDRLDPSRPCAAATSTRACAGARLRRIASAPEGEAEELFGITDTFAAYHYASGGWAPFGAPLTGYAGTVAWLGPEHGLAATAQAEVLWFDHQRISRGPVLIDDTMPTQITGAWIVPSYGVVLGTRFDLLLRQAGAQYHPLWPHAQSGDDIRGLVEHRGSLYFTASAGRLRQLHPRLGYCDGTTLFGDRAPRDVVVLEGGQIVVAPDEIWMAVPEHPDRCPSL